MNPQADSTKVLGTPPDRVETPATAPTCPLEHYFVLATDLAVGDRIRDRGDLHTIDAIEDEVRPLGSSLTIRMEDGGHLSIPLHQHVTVWREVAHA